MQTLEETRKHLPAEYKDKPDQEIAAIRNNVYGLAELMLEVLQDELKEEREVFDKLSEEIKLNFKLDINGDHGVSHWRRVKSIGQHLAAVIDWRVITLFAVLHDSCRLGDGNDPDHGERASEYAVALHKQGLLPANDKQLEQLVFACRHHSDKNFKTDDITIQSCLDADRLDLYRFGEIPDDKYLFTELAKKKKTKDFVLKLLGK